MSSFESYYYNNQLRKYIVQMMAIFADMRVKVGSTGPDKPPREISIPIANASKDRVVAWIKGEQTQNKPLRLPMFTMALQNLQIARDYQHGVGQTRRNAFLPTGGLFPNDIAVPYQYMPVPYRASFQLMIWASNQDQHYQIVEQILSLFDPNLLLQTSDDVLDWARVTSVELTAINFEENLPPATDRRIIQTSMDFETIVYLSVPADYRKNYINKVFLRIAAINTSSKIPFEIIEELDEQIPPIPYEEVFNGDDLDIEHPDKDKPEN